MLLQTGWKSAQHFFQNLKIRPKIQLFGTALTVLLCLIFLSFYSSVAARTTVERATRNAEENLTRIQLYFQHLNTEIAGRLSHLDTSISLRQMLEDQNGTQDSGTVWSVDGLLADIQSLACLERVELYTLDGVCLAATRTTEEPDGGLKPEVQAEVCASPADNLWRDDSDARNSRTDGISVYRAVVSRETGMPIGVTRAVLDGAALADIYNYVGFNLSSELYIFTMSGNLLLPKETTPSILRVGRDSFETYLDTGEGEGRYWFQNEAYCVQSLPLPEYGLYAVSIAPYSSLLQDIRLLQMTILSLGLLCVAAELVFFFFMGRAVSRPIVELTRQVERIWSGNLSLRIQNSDRSEIGILAGSIDNMLDRIEALIQEVAEAERQKRTLELRSLQTQITPHFLYNSLDNLSALAQIGDMEGAYGMAHALGEFYRSVLSDGRSIIRLREEIDIIDSYLRVQSQRYRDRFDYQIDIPPELEQIQIVKLTIQPLVENAIYHGIRNVRRMGHIRITGRLEEEQVILAVEDNGKGFPQESDRLTQSGEKGDLIFHRKGFGMFNADQRIKLYFGPDYGLRVHSERDVGTCVEICLPRKPYEEAQDDFSFNCR